MSASSNQTFAPQMVPYLHFSGGDTLYFKGVSPSSSAAVAGACIVLACIAILERWFAARRSILESGWRKRALNAASVRLEVVRDNAPPSLSKKSPGGIEEVSVMRVSNSTSGIEYRSIPPFIPSIDISRGIVHSGQALLAYALMLAVMTFQVAFILSVIFGLGVGELLFGRLASLHLRR